MTPEEGGYTKIRVLAEGGQGEAALVRNEAGKEVVLKSYSRENENAGGLDELLEEAKNMQECDSCEFIAQCYDIFQDDSFLYMVTNANMGGDWEAVRRKATDAGVPLTEELFRNLFTQALKGLSFLHAHAIMHCDIKEPNLMLQTTDYRNPQVVLIDLGLSQAFTTSTAGICGTPGYIPPETWETNRWVPKGDNYSMGIVFLQVLLDKSGNSEEAPWCQERCESMDEFMRQAQTGDLPFEQVFQEEAAEKRQPLLDWLAACTNKKVAGRPTAKDLLSFPWFDITER